MYRLKFRELFRINVGVPDLSKKSYSIKTFQSEKNSII